MSRTMPRAPRAARRGPVTLLADVFGGVSWTPEYVCFLFYLFVVTTYYLPGASVAVVAALAALLIKPDQWRMSPLLWLFGGFTAWTFLAFGGSQYRSVAWEQTSSVLKLWLIVWIGYGAVRTRAQFRFLLVFAVGCFILFPVRGSFRNFFGGYSLGGRAIWNYAYANPNDLAGFAILFLAMALGVMALSRHRLSKLGAGLAAAAMVALIFFTQSRGALLATGVAVIIYFSRNLRHVNFRNLGYAFLLLVGAAFLAPKGVWDRLGGLKNVSLDAGMRGVDREGSAEQRFQILQIAIRIAQDHPFGGVGPGVYKTIHRQYAAKFRSEFPIAGGGRDAHNTYALAAAELGYPGLAFFLAMIVTTMLRARRAAKGSPDRALASTVQYLSLGLVAFCVAGIFGSMTYINMLYLTLLMLELGTGLLRGSGGRTTHPRLARSQRPPTRSPLPLVAAG